MNKKGPVLTPIQIIQGESVGPRNLYSSVREIRKDSEQIGPELRGPEGRKRVTITVGESRPNNVIGVSIGNYKTEEITGTVGFVFYIY